MEPIEQHTRACLEMMQEMGPMMAMMDGPGGGWGLLMSALWLVLGIGVGVLFVLVASRSVAVGQRRELDPPQGRAVLDVRYAKGELTREQYLEMRREVEAR